MSMVMGRPPPRCCILRLRRRAGRRCSWGRQREEGCDGAPPHGVAAVAAAMAEVAAVAMAAVAVAEVAGAVRCVSLSRAS